MKEVKNVNSEINMRLVNNDNLNYYKFIKELSNPQSNLFNDGYDLINEDKINAKDL